MMDKASIARLVVFILVWLNGLLASKGLKTIPVLDDAQVAGAIAFVVSAYTFFKHNFLGKKGKDLEKEIVKDAEEVVGKVVENKPVAPIAEPVQPAAPQETQTK